MNKSIFNKFASFVALISLFGARSSSEYKAMTATPGFKGKVSLSQFAESDFNNLPRKRVKGKWRVKR